MISMSISLRIVLIVCAALVFFIIMKKLKKSQIQVMDSIFWLVFAFSFLVFAVFPGIAYWLADILGFEAPSNFVFLYTIGILMVHDFSTTAQLAELRRKLNSLVSEVALRDRE